MPHRVSQYLLWCLDHHESAAPKWKGETLLAAPAEPAALFWAVSQTTEGLVTGLWLHQHAHISGARTEPSTHCHPSEQLQMDTRMGGHRRQPPVPTGRCCSLFPSMELLLSFLGCCQQDRHVRLKNVACCTALYPMPAKASLAHDMQQPGRLEWCWWGKGWLRSHETATGKALTPASASLHVGNLPCTNPLPLQAWKSRNAMNS